MSEGVVLQDQARAIIRHNQAAETILGLTGGRLPCTWLDPAWRATYPDGSPFPAEDHPAMVTLRTGQPLNDVVMRIHKADGRSCWLAINSRPLVQPDEPLPYAVLATFRDITDQREISARLAHHQRLVTTGTLAAGVGHEINNPLAYVLTNLSLALEELEAISGGSPSRRMTEIIGMLELAREGGERVKRIVRGLKSLAREDSDLVPTDVNSIVKNAMQMASHEVRTRAIVTLDLADVALVDADESRLSQVLINLIVNAAQAFTRSDPQTNRIMIKTAIDDGVVIDVSDNGAGIAPAVQARMFDPFFTTKQVGEGTGLGLSISHSIITALGGEIRCQTRVGEGTSFRVFLPLAREHAEPIEASTVKQGRLLVVDDERTILATIARVFQRDFEVVAFDDPRDALRRVEAGEAFDVVFCDLSMPYLSGMQLCEAILAINPELASRVVFVSGDLTREDVRHFLARVPNERLEKPVSLQNLRGIARRFARPRT